MPFVLEEPPYALDALEPKISKHNMELHWDKHHRAYVTNLNGQIKDTELDASKDIEEVVKVTWNEGKPTPAFNNAAQVWNHTFFWHSMSPTKTEPSGPLAAAIDRDFGSLDAFKKEFSTAGATQFGSGWAWLVLEKATGKLAVRKTGNAETPLTDGAVVPVLTMDVWEHAYYPVYENRRPEYIGVFVNELINWDKVAERFAAAGGK